MTATRLTPAMVAALRRLTSPPHVDGMSAAWATAAALERRGFATYERIPFPDGLSDHHLIRITDAGRDALAREDASK